MEKNKVIGHSKKAQELSNDDWQSSIMHMTVHQVASQKDIYFSKRRPDKIFIKVVAELKVKSTE